jgi:hypothetical protein
LVGTVDASLYVACPVAMMMLASIVVVARTFGRGPVPRSTVGDAGFLPTSAVPGGATGATAALGEARQSRPDRDAGTK